MTEVTRALPNGLDFVLEQTTDFPPDLESQAVALTAQVFPDEDSLDGKFYYDTPPALIAYALDGERLVALRPIDRRQLVLAGQTIDLAGGIIPTVHPDYRRQGIASAMVNLLLADFAAIGIDYSLAFLFDGAPEWFLDPFDYTRLEHEFIYTNRDTGEDVTETARAYGRALRELEPEVKAAFASKCRLHLGRGTW